MTWNYRIIHSSHFGENTLGDEAYVIKEVYYDDNGNIEGTTVNAISPFGTDLDELKGDLELMLQAFDKPVLEESELDNEL